MSTGQPTAMQASRSDGKPTANLLVFSDDWGRHPSSCQHLVRCLLDRYRVVWVNTIGTRSPRLTRETLTRGLEKIRHWTRPGPAGDCLPANLRVLNPRMWPWFGSLFSRWLNRRLLLHQLTPLIESLPGPTIAVTTLPIVADLIGALPVKRWVYYGVDDFGQWPGLDQVTLRHMDDLMAARADVIVAVSETLQDKWTQPGRDVHLLTHGVDLEFWTNPPRQTIVGLEGLERPLVAFWGVVDKRMDVAFVRQLSAGLSAGTILLAGPHADPDPELLALPRVVAPGPMPYAHLPRLAQEAAVLIMPYADLPVTQAIQPLKLKEYLATGRPVVVRDLPATHGWGDCLDLVDSPESFSAAVRQRLAEGIPNEQAQARRRLAGESWAEKAHVFEKWALCLDRPMAAICTC